MQLFDSLNRFYYNMTLDELRLMNENTIFPDITYNSLLYLDLISYRENCTVSYLANVLHISKSAVTLKVNELIKQGLVAKKQSETDRRIYYLSTAPKVKSEYKQYDKKLNKAVRVLKEHYSDTELDLFCNMLELLCESYMEGTEKDDDK